MTTSETTRKPRETRARKKEWKPPSLLETPKPPPGFQYRWIRVNVRGDEDTRNIINRKREGYEFVRAEELKDFDAPTLDHGTLKGVIGVGDLVLAKIPAEIAKQRKEYYEAQSTRALKAVDEQLRQASHPLMPITQKSRSRVQYVRERQPAFDDDAEEAL